MIDLCMCSETTCPIQASCLRHSDKDMEQGQTYFNPGFERGLDCEWFIDRLNFLEFLEKHKGGSDAENNG